MPQACAASASPWAIRPPRWSRSTWSSRSRNASRSSAGTCSSTWRASRSSRWRTCCGACRRSWCSITWPTRRCRPASSTRLMQSSAASSTGVAPGSSSRARIRTARSARRPTRRPPKLHGPSSARRPSAWCGGATGRTRPCPTTTSRTTHCCSTCSPNGRRTKPYATASWFEIRRRSTASHLPHERRRELLHRAHSALHHRDARLGAQDLQHLRHAGLAERSEPPQVRPADAHRVRAHGERLGDVGPSPEPAVDKDEYPALHRVHDFGQDVDGGAAAVFASPAVVGDDEAVDAVLHAQLRVLGGEDALHDDLHLGRAAQPLDEVPAHVRRLQVGQAFQIYTGVGGLALHALLQVFRVAAFALA